jgi:hypothetical protein
MTYRDFCIWFLGYVEVHKHPPQSEEWAVIVTKLKTTAEDKKEVVEGTDEFKNSIWQK